MGLKSWFWSVAEIFFYQWANPGARYTRRKGFDGFLVYPECNDCGNEHPVDKPCRRSPA